MRALAGILGFFVFLMGAGYLCRPDKVSAFNNWCRNNLFSDRYIIVKRRKTGVMLIFAGILILLLSMK